MRGSSSSVEVEGGVGSLVDIPNGNTAIKLGSLRGYVAIQLRSLYKDSWDKMACT